MEYNEGSDKRYTRVRSEPATIESSEWLRLCDVLARAGFPKRRPAVEALTTFVNRELDKVQRAAPDSREAGTGGSATKSPLVALTADQVTEMGAYEWVNSEGVRHVGFLTAGRRGLVSGSFVAEDGSTRGIMLVLADGSAWPGTFYGPLSSNR